MTASFHLSTVIDAVPTRVFDLSLDTGLHVRSMARWREEVVGVAAPNALTLHDEVTWRARHFGVRFTMTSRIVDLARPRMFVDEQVRGPFAAFRHVHTFDEHGSGTRMTDLVTLRAPLGPVGAVAEAAFLTRHLRMLIEVRNQHLRAEAESGAGPAST